MPLWSKEAQIMLFKRNPSRHAVLTIVNPGAMFKPCQHPLLQRAVKVREVPIV